LLLRPYIINVLLGPGQGRAKLRKHRISFEEAAVAFRDPDALDAADAKHSQVENRRVLIGRVTDNLVVTVVYTRSASSETETTRIISARPASSKERKAYDGGTAPDP